MAVPKWALFRQTPFVRFRWRIVANDGDGDGDGDGVLSSSVTLGEQRWWTLMT